MKIYTGIGSRSTPENILGLIYQVSKKLDDMGFLLRSGGANGADSAFEEFSNNKEIYLPWNGFNNRKHDGISYFTYSQCSGYLIAEKTVTDFHPKPNALTNAGRKLMARNAMQILGADCKSPTNVVICWTNKTGGTNQALRIAKFYNIPILILKEKRVEKFFRDTFLSVTGSLDELP
jgi:hypothetical protein